MVNSWLRRHEAERVREDVAMKVRWPRGGEERKNVAKARGWETGREKITYSQTLTSQLHSPWPGVNEINVNRAYQSVLHAPLHLVKEMPWLLTN